MLASALLVSCEVPEPKDPKIYIPGPQEYYNQALGFSLRYSPALDLDVEDLGVADSPDVAVSIEYPGNELVMFKLATYDPAMLGHVRQYLVPGSEKPETVGGETGSRFRVTNQAYEPDSEAKPTIQHVVLERSGKLFVMTGEGETFEDVLESFKFIDAPPPPAE